MKKLNVDMEGLCRVVAPPTDKEGSAKNVLLYGAGRDLKGYMFELEFISRLLRKSGETGGNFDFIDSISAFVDGNPRKQDHKVKFAGRDYDVLPPESLHHLSDAENTVVIVSSTRFAWEIEKSMTREFGDESFSYVLAPELDCSFGGGQVSFQGIQASDEILG